MLKKTSLNRFMALVIAVCFYGGFALAAPDSYTKLLIHSDTTNEASPIEDSSPSAHNILTFVNPYHETDYSKFGSSSIKFYGQDYLQLDSTDDFNFGTADWTVDFWVRMIATTGEQWVFGTYQGDASNGIALRFSGNRWYMNVGPNWTGQEFVSTVNAGTWYHIAIVGESGGSVKFYQDGVQVGSTWNVNYNITSTNTLKIGTQTNIAGAYLYAYLDEFRVSKGIARWTSNFTPFTVPYNSLSAPANFSATPNDESIQLSWDAVTGADSYKVYYGATSGSLTQSATTSTTNLTLSPLENYSKYFFKVVAVDSTGEGDFSSEISASPRHVVWQSYGNNIAYTAGNVGVGTTTPQSAFAVNGTITCKELEITVDGWADYVFNPTYALMPFEDLRTFIHDKGHLPGIPSEKNLKNEGVSVKEMLTLQMSKIEELTLYVLSLDEENKALKREVEELKKTKLNQ